MNKDAHLENRKFVIAGLVFGIVLIYIVRLFYLQVVDDSFASKANDNAFLTRTLYPARGIIYDRNGRELVYNQPSYQLVVTMREMKNLDTLDFCKTLGITREDFDRTISKIKHTRGYSRFTQQNFTSQLSGEDYGRMSEAISRFPGFDVVKRTIREYKYPIAPHILGNIREVSSKEIERDPYYKAGDYVGDLGVEKYYEQHLRGVKGKEILLRDAHGVIKGHYHDGELDEKPIAGQNITLSIDADLQAYAESLMVNKVGALVAIQPRTGEILAMVSAPSYNPSTLVGRQRGKNYAELQKDRLLPLINRAISATYPPGSTFKPTQGLIGLQTGTITPNTVLPCQGGFRFGNFKMGCHDGTAAWTLVPAIATSCNGYFGWCFYNTLTNKKYKGGVQEAFEDWKNYMVSMGYGYRLGIDLPGEKRGFIPNRGYYNRAFRNEKWNPVSIISISIGQGEIMASPLQIANLAATIANRGHYFTPHVLHSIEGEALPDSLTTPHHTLIDPKYYNAVVEGMRQAAVMGTVRTSGNMDEEGIILCGKTGTAQNPHGRDHSVFMGFAPMDEPEIAICCFIENGGFGATYGVPIGTLVIEKYLNGRISDRRKELEMRMKTSSTLQYMGFMKGN